MRFVFLATMVAMVASALAEARGWGSHPCQPPPPEPAAPDQHTKEPRS